MCKVGVKSFLGFIKLETFGKAYGWSTLIMIILLWLIDFVFFVIISGQGRKLN